MLAEISHPVNSLWEPLFSTLLSKNIYTVYLRNEFENKCFTKQNCLKVDWFFLKENFSQLLASKKGDLFQPSQSGVLTKI